jgi:hypothetical protein
VAKIQSLKVFFGAISNFPFQVLVIIAFFLSQKRNFRWSFFSVKKK